MNNLVEKLCGLTGHHWITLFCGSATRRWCWCCSKEEINRGSRWEKWDRTWIDEKLRHE
jgi:hypothetical protein